MEFADILEQNNIEFKRDGEHHHARPGWISFDCPWCSRDWKHYRMGYNTFGRYVNCWACGRHQLVETLVELIDKPIGAVLRLLREVDPGEKVEKQPRGKLVLPKCVGPLQYAHISYLKGRGFDHKQLVKLWELKGIGIASDLSWRIFIPIIHNGIMVSWTTRSISDRHAKRYIDAAPNQESVDHKEILYGEDYCRHTIIVTEGPTGPWRFGPGAVCSFGLGFSRAQIGRIAKYPRRVICFDQEPVAQRRADELCNLLSVFSGETLNITLETGDPGEAQQAEIDDIRYRFLER